MTHDSNLNPEPPLSTPNSVFLIFCKANSPMRSLIKKKNADTRSGKRAPQLKVCTALAENLSWVSSTNTQGLTNCLLFQL